MWVIISHHITSDTQPPSELAKCLREPPPLAKVTRPCYRQVQRWDKEVLESAVVSALVAAPKAAAAAAGQAQGAGPADKHTPKDRSLPRS